MLFWLSKMQRESRKVLPLRFKAVSLLRWGEMYPQRVKVACGVSVCVLRRVLSVSGSRVRVRTGDNKRVLWTEVVRCGRLWLLM